MNRQKRRSVKKPAIIESDESSDDESPVKKSKVTPKKKVEHPVTEKQNTNDSSSSESDIENYLQPIDKLDLSSEFFNLKKDSNNDEFSKIEKSIFEKVGTSRLSDSESDLDDVQASTSQISTQGTTESQQLNFKQLEDFTKNIEEAKLIVEKYNAKKKIEEKNVDISNILASGESKQLTLENIREEDLHSSDFETTDGEEWEEVKQKDQEEKSVVPKKDIEIRIGAMPEHCRNKKGTDLIAAMKRRLNRIRKENQLYVHKVHLLCWLAHGNFVNSVISSSDILSVALSLLPSDKCYPSDRVDLSYLEQIVQWYKRTIKLKEKDPVQQLPLKKALSLQMMKKESYDKKMFVLIFIAILRSLGIQCRMVLSLQVEPLRPPSSELHSLSTKESTKKLPSSKTGQLNKSHNKSNSKSDAKKLPSNKSAQLNKSHNKSNSKSEGKTKQINSEDVKLKKAKEGIQKVSKLGKEKATKDTSQKKDQNKHKEPQESSRNSVSDKNKKPAKEEQILSSKPKKERETTELKTNKMKGGKVEETKIVNKGNKKDNTKDNNTRTSSKMSHKETVQTTKESKSSKSSKKESLKVDEESESKSSVTENKESVETTITQPKPSTSVSKMRSRRSRRSTEKNIPQLDGANDTIPKTVSNTRKPNLRKLKNESNAKVNSAKDSRSRVKVNNNNDSEDDFSPSPSKRSPIKKPNFAKLSQPSTSKIGNPFDVKNDIINLIKGRIIEQKHMDRGKLVNKRKSQNHDSSSDSDYLPSPIKKKHHDSDSDIEYFVPKPKVKKRVKVNRVGPGHPILSDSGEEGKKKKGNDVWLEVYLESEEKWITADVIRGQVHCVNELYMRATHPVSYVVAWNNDHTIKDVSMRYCKNFNTVTRKLRIDSNWWESSIRPFKEKSTARSKEEDADLNKQLFDQPLPKSIAEYKNHPLYALQRHVLKFEAIYPPDQVPLGYVRGEAVYPRNCVYICKSRDIWLKDAKVVKPGEKPYKIVKARPKYDKLSNSVVTDQLLEIYGPWQTTDYDPPTAENGVVPRNAFGNVELFKKCMLPKKTVHLQLPGLNKVAKKLNIDCASAIVGFDFHGGWSHPVYDGFVVCEEFTDVLIAAWEQDREEMEKKENEKIEKRVYTNWKRLIKGLLIRERLKARYDFGGEPSQSEKGKKNAAANKSTKGNKKS
uniref:DNA repair protein complementing XP-C cells homolog n=1 Tax=Diabrotica virgifera virgifera TaxID=50390 RepID=A0A6P7FG93_DIAVI